MSAQLENCVQLTEEQLQSYQRDGFVLIENLISEDLLNKLRERLRDYTHGGLQNEKLKMQVEPRVKRGELEVSHPGDAYRKIDGLVEGDEVFRELGTHTNIVSIIEQILGPDLKMFRNSMMLKPPMVGSQKGMHQDSPYWPITPMDLCSCWFPLDDATMENGCMGVLPGAHKKGALPHVNVQDDFVMDEECYSATEIEFKPMKAGSGLFFHSLLPHYTAPNKSKNWRRAIALSYMSSKFKFSRESEGPEYLHIQGNSYEGCVR